MAIPLFSHEAPVAAVLSRARVSSVQDPQRLMEKIRSEFSAQKGRFETLEPAGKSADSVRVYDTWGANVAVKFCGMEFENGRAAGFWMRSGAPIRFAWDNGSNVELYTEFFKAYGKSLSESSTVPEKYALVPIEAYGTFRISEAAGAHRVYLVMERFRPEIDGIVDMPSVPSLWAAWEELSGHWRIFEEKARGAVPQLVHSLILGNTHKENPEKGKWVFALPHDFE